MLKTDASCFPEPQTIVLLGIPFHDTSLSEVLDLIATLIACRRSAFFVTANLDFAAKSSKDVELQRILVGAEMVLCDGVPLLWISRFTSHPLKEKVSGSDLVPLLATRAAQEGWRIFMLGGTDETLERASRNLKINYPGIVISGTYAPPFAPLHQFDNGEIVKRIKEASPDILLVAFGCPKQEKWIYEHYEELGVPFSIGVGASIDFMAGKVHRAPQWIAKCGLEWVFRMVQEPKRLAGRYIEDILFLLSQLLREKKLLRPSQSSEMSKSHRTFGETPVEIIFWEGPLIEGSLSCLGEPSFSKQFVINLSRVTMIDSAGLGHLLHTIRCAWSKGIPGCYAAPSEEVAEMLRMTRLDRVLPLTPSIGQALEFLVRENEAIFIPPEFDVSGSTLLLVMPANITKQNTAECHATISGEWRKRPSLRTLQLDCGSTHSMDSSGLRLLVKTHCMVTEREGGSLELLGVSTNVRNVIMVAGLENSLGILCRSKANNTRFNDE